MPRQSGRGKEGLSLGGSLAKGLLLGAIAGGVWVASRKRGGPPPDLIDWDRVRSAAEGVAGRAAGVDGPPLSRSSFTREHYATWVRQSADLIGRYVGSDVAARDEAVHVFDPREWIVANLAGFRLLFAPLERINREVLYDGTVGSFVLGSANRLLLSSELGLLLGYLSRRVLGQYDLALLGREPLVNGEVGRLYFVEPNIDRLQDRLDLDPVEFRLWIALHETTHAFEFENHTWLRTYMNGLLGQYFDSLSADLLGLRKGPAGGLDFVQRVGGNLFRSANALEAIMSAEQREIFGRLQALMALVEGYSNHVMDQVGSRLLASYPTMKARFEDRLKHRSIAETLLARVTGLDVKLEQYALGERFVAEVVRRRGIEFANRAWRDADSLPTLAEVREPASWIARLDDRL